MTASEFANRLDAKPVGDSWVARCPAHDDRRASLSIGSGVDGRVLVKCHAGCTVEAITNAANLTTADLFTTAKKRTTAKKIVAAYEYEDEAGTVLYEAVRMDPKDFFQRRPDGRGGWIKNMQGVRRVVYHLSDIHARLTDTAAIEYRRQHNRPDDVFIVEGEKDADRLWCQGLIATTNVGGAGKWRDDYAQQLVTAGVSSVVVLPDNDDAGRQHAADVARSCMAAGLTVKVVTLPNLPVKGDVSDWLQADGQTLEKLLDLVQAAPVYDTPPTREPADLGATLRDVEAFITKHVVLSADAATLIALSIAQTHTSCFDYVAYLNIKSPLPECGKTRLLEVLEALVSKPWRTDRVTAAVLMRKVDAEHPTLLHCY